MQFIEYNTVLDFLYGIVQSSRLRSALLCLSRARTVAIQSPLCINRLFSIWTYNCMSTLRLVWRVERRAEAPYVPALRAVFSLRHRERLLLLPS